MIELHAGRPDLRPNELIFLQPLRIEADAGAVPPGDLNSVCSFGAEDVKRATERVIASIAHQRQKAIGTFTEVDGVACQKHLHTRRDHADRTARRTPSKMSLIDVGTRPDGETPRRRRIS